MKEAGREWTRDDAIRSHSRHEARARRIERERREEEALYETLGSGSALERRKAAVDAILALAAKLGKKP